MHAYSINAVEAKREIYEMLFGKIAYMPDI